MIICSCTLLGMCDTHVLHEVMRSCPGVPTDIIAMILSYTGRDSEYIAIVTEPRVSRSLKSFVHLFLVYGHHSMMVMILAIVVPRPCYDFRYLVECSHSWAFTYATPHHTHTHVYVNAVADLVFCIRFVDLVVHLYPMHATHPAIGCMVHGCSRMLHMASPYQRKD